MKKEKEEAPVAHKGHHVAHKEHHEAHKEAPVAHKEPPVSHKSAKHKYTVKCQSGDTKELSAEKDADGPFPSAEDFQHWFTSHADPLDGKASIGGVTIRWREANA